MKSNTINAEEIKKFSKISSEWWNPEGKFKPLHKFNPIRIHYIKYNIINNFKIKNKIKPLKDIDILDIPYRHESTYPVSLDELLELLENLIGSIANPRSRRKGQLDFEATEPPDFKEYFVSFENIVEKYESLITRKISTAGSGLLREIVMDLDSLDSIRCFFAVLFLAQKQKVELAQIDDDIQITLIDDNKKGEENGQASK